MINELFVLMLLIFTPLLILIVYLGIYGTNDAINKHNKQFLNAIKSVKPKIKKHD